MRSERILIIHTWGIGDWLFFKPTFDHIRESYPHHSIDVIIGTPGTKAIVSLAEGISELHVFDVRSKPLGIVKIAAKLFRRKYDFLVFTAGISTKKADLTALLFRAKVKIALRTGEYTPHILNATSNYDPTAHMVENNLKLLSLIGLNQPRVGFPKLVLQESTSRAGEGHFLIHPGCDKKNAFKRWPTERFADLAEELLAKGETVDVVLGPDEGDLEAAFDSLKGRQGFQILKHLKLQEVLERISRCKLFLNTDSGLSHIAAALGRPVLTISGPADPRTTRPYSPHSFLVEPTIQLACRPCTVPGGRQGCEERPCVMSIDLKMVEKRMKELLATLPS